MQAQHFDMSGKCLRYRGAARRCGDASVSVRGIGYDPFAWSRSCAQSRGKAVPRNGVSFVWLQRKRSNNRWSGP